MGVKERVQRFGLRVCCLACGYQWRHVPGREMRLRRVKCPRCEARAAKPEWWVERYPDLALEEARRARALRRVLDHA